MAERIFVCSASETGDPKADEAIRRKRRRHLRALLIGYIGRLRGILKTHAPRYYARFPDAPRPCITCAFNPSTDRMRGFDTTAMHMMDALTAGTPFYCHEPLPYKKGAGWTIPLEYLRDRWLSERLRPCAGWWVVKDDPEARRAFARACRPDVITDAHADQIVEQMAELRREQGFIG